MKNNRSNDGDQKRRLLSVGFTQRGLGVYGLGFRVQSMRVCRLCHCSVNARRVFVRVEATAYLCAGWYRGLLGSCLDSSIGR